jgi:hypothetical protein
VVQFDVGESALAHLNRASGPWGRWASPLRSASIGGNRCWLSDVPKFMDGQLCDRKARRPGIGVGTAI